MVNNNNTKYLELEELGQELQKKKKKELWQKRLNASITWTGGSILTCFIVPAFSDDPWSMIYLFIGGAVIGLPIIFWAWNGLNNVNQEIKKLERKRKDLRNSIR